MKHHAPGRFVILGATLALASTGAGCKGTGSLATVDAASEGGHATEGTGAGGLDGGAPDAGMNGGAGGHAGSGSSGASGSGGLNGSGGVTQVGSGGAGGVPATGGSGGSGAHGGGSSGGGVGGAGSGGAGAGGAGARGGGAGAGSLGGMAGHGGGGRPGGAGGGSGGFGGAGDLCSAEPPTGCCNTANDCGLGQHCVGVKCDGADATAGSCRSSLLGGGLGVCWVDADCPSTFFCNGPLICPCGTTCSANEIPGQCEVRH